MNTAGLLESEYREVEKLFFQIANASDSEMRTRLCEELADHLSAFAALEDSSASCSSH